MNKSNGKERILAVERILSTRPKKTQQILNILQYEYDIIAEIKAIYNDIAILSKFINIQKNKDGYYVENDLS